MGVGDLGQAADVGDGSEVARGDDVDRRGGAALVLDPAEGVVEGGHRDAVGDAVGGVDRGQDVAGVEAGEYDAVAEARMGAALGDDVLTEAGDGKRDGAVGLGGAVGEEPGAAGSPGIGGQGQGLGERGIVLEVDALEQHGHIEMDRLLADEVGQQLADAGVRAAVAGDHEFDRIAGRQCTQGSGIGSLILIELEATVSEAVRCVQKRFEHRAIIMVESSRGNPPDLWFAPYTIWSAVFGRRRIGACSIFVSCRP